MTDDDGKRTFKVRITEKPQEVQRIKCVITELPQEVQTYRLRTTELPDGRTLQTVEPVSVERKP